MSCKNQLMSFFIAVLTVCFLTGCADLSHNQGGGYQVTDVEGTVITIAHKPQRILTVSAGTDELMLGLVEPERMAAINESLADREHTNIPWVCDRIPTVIPRSPSVEQIAALHPERGEKLVGMMEEKLAEIRAKVAEVPEEKKHKSIALISIMVNYGGAGCTFDELCRCTDSINAKAAAGNRMGQEMTKEQLVAANPDYLFFPSYEDGATNEENYGRQYLEDPSLAQMTAVRERQIGHPWARYVYNLSQDIVYGIQETAWILYGDEFKQSRHEFLTAVE